MTIETLQEEKPMYIKYGGLYGCYRMGYFFSYNYGQDQITCEKFPEHLDPNDY